MTTEEKSRHILQGLATLATSSKLSMNELRIILALERIVARIEAHSVLRDKLIFKGGFVLLKSFGTDRFTRDLDVLAQDIPKHHLLDHLGDALQAKLDDGVHFGQTSVEDLLDQGRYGGYRIRIPFQIGPLPKERHKLKKLSRVHLDVGFGDAILGKPKRTKVPSIVEGEAPISWRIYPLESIYAEKLETLVSRGAGNSRAKDLFDLVVLFDRVRTRKSLGNAIQKTFSNRETEMPSSFADFFKKLDLVILERSWGSVELIGIAMSFVRCRRQLLTTLKALDEIIAS
jgi:hypothetical protein